MQVRPQNAHHGGQPGPDDDRDQGLEGGKLRITTTCPKDGNLSFSSRQANTEKPKWNEEELETRTGVMSLVKLEDCHIAKLYLFVLLCSCHIAKLYFFCCCQVEEKGGFTDAGLKKQITVDMSAPVVGGIIPDRVSFDHITHLQLHSPTYP